MSAVRFYLFYIIWGFSTGHLDRSTCLSNGSIPAYVGSSGTSIVPCLLHYAQAILALRIFSAVVACTHLPVRTLRYSWSLLQLSSLESMYVYLTISSNSHRSNYSAFSCRGVRWNFARLAAPISFQATSGNFSRLVGLSTKTASDHKRLGDRGCLL